MKTGGNPLHKLSSTLQSQHRHVLVGLSFIALLAILILSNIILNSYQLVSLTITSNQDIKALTQFRYSVSKQAIQAAPMNNGKESLFGSSFASIPVDSHFVVSGIEFSPDSKMTAAIIQTGSGEEEIYHIGDKLPQGAIVTNITNDYVTIMNNGILEKISFQWDENVKGKRYAHEQ